MSDLIKYPYHAQAALLRAATEIIKNEERNDGYCDKISDMYKDKQVCKEYEEFLDKIGAP